MKIKAKDKQKFAEQAKADFKASSFEWSISDLYNSDLLILKGVSKNASRKWRDEGWFVQTFKSEVWLRATWRVL